METTSREPLEGLLPTGTPGPGAIREYRGAGGRSLRYREVAAAAPRHRLLYVHGIESHGAWFLPAAWGLAERGVSTWLLDRRGSGLNRGQGQGDAESADCLLEDVRRFREHAGDPPLCLVGLSWGGKLATAAAIDRPRNVRGLVLVTPGLRVRVRLPFASLLRVAAGLLGGPGPRVAVPIEDTMFSEDPRVLDYVRRDPWRTRAVTARLLLAGRALDRRVDRGIAALRVPLLLLLAGRDRIVDEAGVLDLLGRLAPGLLHARRYEGAAHSIQLERTQRLVDDIALFLDDVERDESAGRAADVPVTSGARS